MFVFCKLILYIKAFAIRQNHNDICSVAVNFQLRDDFSGKFRLEIKRFLWQAPTIWQELGICYVKQTLRIRHVGCLNNLQYHLFASALSAPLSLSFSLSLSPYLSQCRIKLES